MLTIEIKGVSIIFLNTLLTNRGLSPCFVLPSNFGATGAWPFRAKPSKSNRIKVLRCGPWSAFGCENPIPPVAGAKGIPSTRI